MKRTDILGRSGFQVKSCERLRRRFGKTPRPQVIARRPSNPDADHIAAVSQTLFQEDDAIDIRSLVLRPSPPATVVVLTTDEYRSFLTHQRYIFLRTTSAWQAINLCQRSSLISSLTWSAMIPAAVPSSWE